MLSQKKKGKNSKNNILKERILYHPLSIFIIFIIITAAFIWGDTTIGGISFLLFLCTILGAVALGSLMTYIFIKIIKGMRKGYSYTVFNADTPAKRFFEYVFVTIFTLGVGLFFFILAIMMITWEYR